MTTGTKRLLVLFLLCKAVAPAVLAEPAEGIAQVPAPIVFSYEILGNAIVGQPIAINLRVSSSQAAPINIEYRIIDSSSMVFPESQALAVEVTPSADGEPTEQRITVVPQREGRLYLNVSGSVESAAGTLIKAAAIPIRVGAAPRGEQVNDDPPPSPAAQTDDSGALQQN